MLKLTHNKKKCRPRFPRPASPESGKGASRQARQTSRIRPACRCVCLTNMMYDSVGAEANFVWDFFGPGKKRAFIGQKALSGHYHVLICDIKKIESGPKMKIGIHAISAGHKFIRSGLGGLAAI